MAGGGGGGKTWIGILVLGFVLAGAGMGLHAKEMGPAWLTAALLALGGLGIVGGSCESMIKSVEGLGQRLGWNEFVAGTMAGLASNIPEIVMLAFVVLAEPRVAFVVVALTLHVGALAFGVYCGLLPRDKTGMARLPDPLVKLSTDLFAAGGAVFLCLGMLMLTMRALDVGDHAGEALGAGDLYVVGIALLCIEVVAVRQLVMRFAGPAPEEEATPAEAARETARLAALPEAESPAAAEAEAPPSIGVIAFYGVLGAACSLVGGHAVGDFAGMLVEALTARGYSEMLGAIILSVFACSGVYLMIATAHFKGMYDVALANASGAINQVPFVVLPVVLILTAAFAQLGVLDPALLPKTGVLAIDFETTSVVLFGFPIFLILWKSVQDDGQVNWLETASMVAVFALIIYFLAQHGH